ncbi:MAG TPA: AMP-binding protein [Burkholderiales bacterium]|nr:AMP-binding protein [Burkholderiales bacterium]
MAHVAAISHADAADVIAYDGARPVSAARFVADVERVAEILPARAHLVNFCVDRYRFAVGLIAALVRGQVSLLPPNQTSEMLRQLQRDYEGLYVLSDAPQEPDAIEHVMYPQPARESARRTSTQKFSVPAFAGEKIAAVAFTSGSTGVPMPHRKTWGALARGATAEADRFALHLGGRSTLVGTVPAQHMYGLESTVLMALRGGLALHAGRPFYPADVAAALAGIPGDRVLVTTPVHLRALLNEDIALPGLRLIVCATAPLSAEMAALAEARYRAPLHEVYGFTEAGMVATRRTVEGPAWRCLRDVRLLRNGEGMQVAGGHVENEVPFNDVIEPDGDDVFILHGRNADLVNIAGKRTSLGYLNHHLNSIEGVRDGVFFMPDETGDGVTRLTAFVVAPGVTRDVLLGALRTRIDAVFLPRPLYFVQALPRNATGKLARETLLRLAQTCSVRDARGDIA